MGRIRALSVQAVSLNLLYSGAPVLPHRLQTTYGWLSVRPLAFLEFHSTIGHPGAAPTVGSSPITVGNMANCCWYTEGRERYMGRDCVDKWQMGYMLQWSGDEEGKRTKEVRWHPSPPS